MKSPKFPILGTKRGFIWATWEPGEWGKRLTPAFVPPQFWDRCKLFLMPAKHQPDYVFLRHVPLRRIHLFTLVQIVCLAVLWILKSTVAAIIFPVMVRPSPGLLLQPRLEDLFLRFKEILAWSRGGSQVLG